MKNIDNQHPFLSIQNNKIRIAITVRAGAKKNSLVGVYDQRLKISIAAVAESGRANQELVDFLAEELCCKKNQVKIVIGAQNKLKLVELNELDLNEVIAWIETALKKVN